jgi:hypothetical protein
MVPFFRSEVIGLDKRMKANLVPVGDSLTVRIIKRWVST